MARFGRDFVRAATQPAYLEGLFTAAKDISGLPARAAAAQQQASLQKGLFGLEQMAESRELTAEMLEEARGSYAALIAKNPKAAKDIRQTLKAVSGEVETAQKEETAAEILRLQDELRTIVASNLPIEAQSAQIVDVQRRIREAAQNLSFAEQQALGARSEQIRRNAEQEERAAATFEMRKKEFDEWADNADLRDEQREVAFIKLEEYRDNGFIREAERREAALRAALPNAKRLIIVAGKNEDALERAEQAFLAANPKMEVVWEEATQQVTKGLAVLAQSQDVLTSSEFNYTDQQLEEMGFTENQITVIKSQNTNQLKNKAVYNTAKANLDKGGLPSATLANLFVKASEARAREILIGQGKISRRQDLGEKDQAKVDRLAAEIGLAAAQKAQGEDDLTKGFAEVAGYQVKEDNDTTTGVTQTSRTSRIDALDRELNPK